MAEPVTLLDRIESPDSDWPPTILPSPAHADGRTDARAGAGLRPRRPPRATSNPRYESWTGGARRAGGWPAGLQSAGSRGRQATRATIRGGYTVQREAAVGRRLDQATRATDRGGGAVGPTIQG